jgi:hypothetical protein
MGERLLGQCKLGKRVLGQCKLGQRFLGQRVMGELDMAPLSDVHFLGHPTDIHA